MLKAAAIRDLDAFMSSVPFAILIFASSYTVVVRVRNGPYCKESVLSARKSRPNGMKFLPFEDFRKRQKQRLTVAGKCLVSLVSGATVRAFTLGVLLPSKGKNSSPETGSPGLSGEPNVFR